MQEELAFSTKEYRDGFYQGMSLNDMPEGAGLFLDDYATLYCSIWRNGMCNGRTVVFFDKAKYIYGEWSQGKPYGFNVFRSNSIVLLGNYHKGQLHGTYILILQNIKQLIVVHPKDDKQEQLFKYYYSTDQQLKSIFNKQFPQTKQKEDFLQIIIFLKYNFCSQQSIMKLENTDEGLRFGFKRGLATVFNDDNQLIKMGNMDERRKIIGLGIVYNFDSYEEGNFETMNIIKYQKGGRPSNRLKALYKDEHIKGIDFKNYYVKIQTLELNKILQDTLQKLMVKMAIESEILQRSSNKQSLKDRLQNLQKNRGKTPSKRVQSIHKRDNQDQINRIKTQIRYNKTQQPKNIHTQMNHLYNNTVYRYKILDPESIRFDTPPEIPTEINRSSFLNNNSLEDYRDFPRGSTKQQHQLKSRYDRNSSYKPGIQSQYQHNMAEGQSLEYKEISKKVPSMSKSKSNSIHHSYKAPTQSLKRSSNFTIEATKQLIDNRKKEIQISLQKQRQMQRSKRKIMNETINKRLDHLQSLKNSQTQENLKRQSSQSKRSFENSDSIKLPEYLVESHARPFTLKTQPAYHENHPTKSHQYQSNQSRQSTDFKNIIVDSQVQPRNSKYRPQYQTKIQENINQNQKITYNTPPKSYLSSIKRNINRDSTGLKQEPQHTNEQNKNKSKSKNKFSTKVIEIEHERISPEGKKTMTFERIVKKYSYYQGQQ